MPNKIYARLRRLCQDKIFKNSSWGIIAHVVQTVLISGFFIIVARVYSTSIFADYIIATVLYQLVAAFSSLGLSQWFIRELSGNQNKQQLVTGFLKTQGYFGIFFYGINILLAFLIYKEHSIHILSIVLGVNIIFDNLINAIKSVNIAQFEQKKTFAILTIDAVLKFLFASLLFVYPFSILILSVGLILIRLATLNLFLKYGAGRFISFKSLTAHKINFSDIKNLVVLNWPFVVIGGVSIINWRIANIIISKTLSAAEVANYEISYKLFSIAQILPVIISGSIFPVLIDQYQKRNKDQFRSYYQKAYLLYLLFGLFAYTFTYCFSDVLIPLGFGSKYQLAASSTCMMFLTILVFPTAFLQANVLVAIGKERVDMLFNVVLLIVNVSICIVGLQFFKSLLVVYLAIFISFCIFHVLQDVFLVRRRIASLKFVLRNYILLVSAVGMFLLAARWVSATTLFVTYWLTGVVIFLLGTQLRRDYLQIWTGKKINLNRS